MNRVRILSGRWKGRSLQVPAGARPTSGRAREGVFSMLQETLPGMRVLDLYAGSGAFGLEAVSRGASGAVLVERHAAAIDRSLERLGSPPEVEVLRGDVEEALNFLASRGDRFDLVFSDPPYALSRQQAFPAAALALVAPGGLLVAQVDRPKESPAEPDGWTLLKRRHYGRNVFLFLAPAASRMDLTVPEGFDHRNGKC
ncbi:MAG TPA: 16S rRNA (guanine(966)-N(2))-methyltransferase RsmD [Thermoanaerobaculia bacterium]|nr:16S rRNA (guanine(966)-N(2))-methyltransferase RsmD [Thermoanaerobaculia bacterium]